MVGLAASKAVIVSIRLSARLRVRWQWIRVGSALCTAHSEAVRVLAWRESRRRDRRLIGLDLATATATK